MGDIFSLTIAWLITSRLILFVGYRTVSKISPMDVFGKETSITTELVKISLQELSQSNHVSAEPSFHPTNFKKENLGQE